MTAAAPGQTGRPRDASTDGKVIQATLDLVGAGETLESLSFVAIAARAGVGRNTLYRRWPTKEALLLDVLAAVNPPPPGELPDDAREILVMGVKMIYDRTADPRVNRLLRCLVAESDRYPELENDYIRTVLNPRRQVLLDAIDRGIREGLLRPDVDPEDAFFMIAGPAIFQSFIHATLEKVDPAHARSRAETLVDLALSGLAPNGPD